MPPNPHGFQQSQETYLKLAETLNGFLARLRSSAEALDVSQRQRIVRLLVKEVLVGDETIVIRHSIPIPNAPQNDYRAGSESDPDNNTTESYLLRSGIWEPYGYGNLSPCGR